ncbi:Carboxylesterase family [Ceratobasidium sp. AG-Ba]|nr:Carboxylesterase family [Ceratobasidium sp. AG-Ba]
MILESGSPSSLYVPPASDPAIERVYKFVVNATGCAGFSDAFECMRAAPYAKLYQANQDILQIPLSSTGPDPGNIFLGPTLAPGDKFLSELPGLSIHSGRFAKVPFLAGSQLDEGTLFVDGQQPETEQDLIDWLTGKTPGGYVGITNASSVKDLLKFYSPEPAAGSPYGTGNQTFGLAAQYKRLASVVGDLVFEASRRDFTSTATKSYQLTEVIDPAGKEQYGVYHGGDIPFVFQTVHTAPGIPQALITLEQSVAEYWLSFAYNLDPNKGLFTPSKKLSIMDLKGDGTEIDFRTVLAPLWYQRHAPAAG